MKKRFIVHKIIIQNFHWLIKLLLSIKYQTKKALTVTDIIDANCQYNFILFYNHVESTNRNDHPSLTGM